MLITKEIDYSLRILSALASGEQMTMGDICSHEWIPQQFGYKILKKLAKAGMVAIIRGNGGGCRLCCDLRQVTLYELVQAVGSEPRIAACMEPEYECARRLQNHNFCAIHHNLTSIQQTLEDELKKHTLGELIGI